jgi:ABC-type phosphonate transport system ATPase subunit
MVQSQNNKAVLQAKSISKTFGGIKALDVVNMEVYKGQVNAIVGENGAALKLMVASRYLWQPKNQNMPQTINVASIIPKK